MTESFILDYIPKRMKQLGYSEWHIRYRDLGIWPEDEIKIPAYNEIWFLVGHPSDIEIDSDYGIYAGVSGTGENQHEHRGNILIRNHSKTKQRIIFIQTIIVN